MRADEADRGSGPLVLIHPTWEAWKPVLPLLELDFEVIAMDLPGFGSTAAPVPPAALSVGSFADFLETELTRQGLHRPAIAGDSLGASVALELARRGRASSVTAISPLGLGTPRECRRTLRRLQLVRAVTPAARPFIGLAARTAFGRTLVGGAGFQLGRPWRHERDGMVAAARDFWLAPGLMNAYRWALTHPAEGLDQIQCPTTIAWGTRDYLLYRRQAARFVRTIPGAEYVELRHLGHVPMSDDPEKVSRVIAATARKPIAKVAEPREEAL